MCIYRVYYWYFIYVHIQSLALVFHICFKHVFPYIQGCIYSFYIASWVIYMAGSLTFTLRSFSRLFCRFTVIHIYIPTLMAVAAVQGAAYIYTCARIDCWKDCKTSISAAGSWNLLKSDLLLSIPLPLYSLYLGHWNVLTSPLPVELKWNNK